jgi:hypothetical protein
MGFFKFFDVFDYVLISILLTAVNVYASFFISTP